MICRTVQRELDKIKTAKNDQAKRARRILQIVRAMLSQRNSSTTVKEGQPVVKLFLDRPGPPSSELQGVLDYSKADDELIGYVHRHSSAHAEAEVHVLTHDTGVMATAKHLDIAYQEISDLWLVGSQQEAADPEKMKLKERVKELEAQEPKIEIKFLNTPDDDNLICIEHSVYEPLAPAKIEAYIQKVRTIVPMETNFESSRASHEGTSTRTITRLMKDYKPVTEAQIREYQDKEYPDWLKDCESLLSDLHALLQDRQSLPTFELEATNVGSRPAHDVLVRFIAEGKFQIRVEEPPDTEPSGDSEVMELELPGPPSAPAGRWTGPLHNLSSIGRSFEFPSIRDLPYLDTAGRDPNAFYYKPRRPVDATDSFSLECEQWRHKSNPEVFEATLCFSPDTEEFNGRLSCEIHASNLSTPVRSNVRIRIRTKRVSTEPAAEDLLQRLEQSYGR